MALVYKSAGDDKFQWVCYMCYSTKSVTVSTPAAGCWPRLFDIALTLWCMSQRSQVAARVTHRFAHTCYSSSTMSKYQALFRDASSHFVQTKVHPYLTLRGGVEIDESKVSSRKFASAGGTVSVRWIFGMVCRKTKISIIYSIRDKKIENLVPLLKKHIKPGTHIFTDSHMSYCSSTLGTSKLSKYGWYHYWTNHSIRMVHEKLPFCHSMRME